jgi:hypothetical protein
MADAGLIGTKARQRKQRRPAELQGAFVTDEHASEPADASGEVHGEATDDTHLAAVEAQPLRDHAGGGRATETAGALDQGRPGALPRSRNGRHQARSAATSNDDFANGKRWWVRLHEKGGKRHELAIGM